MPTNVNKPPSDRPTHATERTCLKCRRRFPSAWEGERICRRCKDSHEWRSGGSQFDD